MRFQVDITLKTIKIENQVNLGLLYDQLSTMFPNESWREYTIEVAVIINWINPIIIDTPTIPPNKPFWELYPVTCEQEGVYNVSYGQ